MNRQYLRYICKNLSQFLVQIVNAHHLILTNVITVLFAVICYLKILILKLKMYVTVFATIDLSPYNFRNSSQTKERHLLSSANFSFCRICVKY